MELKKIGFILFVFVSLAIGRGNRTDFFEKYSNYRFVEYSKDQEVYQIIFNTFKEDFLFGGIELTNVEDQKIFEKYIDLRNIWLKNNSIESYVMAIELTRLLISIIQEYSHYRDELYNSKGEYVAIIPKFLKSTVLKKYQVFPVFDNIVIKRNKKWVALTEFEKGIQSEGKTPGWLNYIKKIGLKYMVDSYYNIQMLIDSDSTNIPFFGACAINYIKNISFEKVLLETAAVVDLGKMTNEIYNFYIQNNLKINSTKLDFYLSCSHCKNGNLWLYTNQIDCKADEEVLSRGRVYIDRNYLRVFFNCSFSRAGGGY